jgi:hypothetical protein
MSSSVVHPFDAEAMMWKRQTETRRRKRKMAKSENVKVHETVGQFHDRRTPNGY